jgi:hypothetical protein
VPANSPTRQSRIVPRGMSSRLPISESLTPAWINSNAAWYSPSDLMSATLWRDRDRIERSGDTLGFS